MLPAFLYVSGVSYFKKRVLLCNEDVEVGLLGFWNCPISIVP